jgi:MFS family permease
MATITMERPAVRTIAAVVIGNALDWYDFALYGYLAVTIGTLFFPSESPWTSLLSSLAAFGSAFVVRPFGGIFLAQMADQWGRRNTLILVIALMTVGTVMIAFAPTYAAIGIAAPVIIVLSRLLQGFSAGGEFASATAFLVEVAPPSRRGLYGAWQLSGQGMAILLSGFAGSLLARGMTPEQFTAWGWRVPFVVGLVIGPVGYYLRLRLQESRIFIDECARRRGGPAPLLELFTNFKRRVLTGFGLVIGGSASLYVLFIFMPTYAIRVLGLDLSAAFIAPVVAGLTVAVFCPITGALSDLVGRKSLLVVSMSGLVIAPYPCFLWLQQERSVAQLALVEFAFGLIFSFSGGPFNAALSELFPVRLRASGLAVAYNFAVALFGGLAPLIVAWLILRTGDPLAPTYYVAACTLVGLAAALSWPSSGPVE